MTCFKNTRHRSDSIELMDDFSIDGEVLYDTLDKLVIINKWLGGNRVTIQGLRKLLLHQDKVRVFTVLDLGCGSGDILREVANFGRRKGYHFKLIGVDANASTLAYARKLSKGFSEIRFVHCDIFSEAFDLLHYDIVLSTLFLHHLNDNELLGFFPKVVDKSSLGVVVNDLHRHPMAYFLFRMLSLFITNEMVKKDGSISVLRGFKRKELENLTEKIGGKATIAWKWAFRYQWIINKSICM